VILSLIFILYSSNLLISLLVIEIISFRLLYFFSITYSIVLISDFVLIFLFSIFVIEGAIALSGLIVLVSFSGSDYVRSYSFLKL
jgi:hypothetical protein